MAIAREKMIMNLALGGMVTVVVAISLIVSVYGSVNFDGARQVDTTEDFEVDEDVPSQDTDRDGLADIEENYLWGTNKTSKDTDQDGMTDGWEAANGLNPSDDGTSAPDDLDDQSSIPEGHDDESEIDLFPNPDNGQNGDPDKDGLTNIEEFRDTFDKWGYSTNPNNWDTDGDGLNDRWEFIYSEWEPNLETMVPNGTNTHPDSQRTDRNSDHDQDGLFNWMEEKNRTNPRLADTDGDGLSDWVEIVEAGTDPTEWDTDGDGMPDGFEWTYRPTPASIAKYNAGDLSHPGLNATDDTDAYQDFDFDLLVNIDEYNTSFVWVNYTSPLSQDTDADLMPDGWEFRNNIDPTRDNAFEDPDNDSYDINGDGNITQDERCYNLIEYLQKDSVWRRSTSPNTPDTDGDGLLDCIEIRGYRILVNDYFVDVTTNPHVFDTDGDGLADAEEAGQTPCRMADTDGDGLEDTPVYCFLNGSSPDTDLDGLPDFQEAKSGFWYLPDNYLYFLNASNTDTDGDLLVDGEEIVLGADQYITNGSNPDTDRDGLKDGEETVFQPRPCHPTDSGVDPRDCWTDPTNNDTDGDGMFDGYEMFTGNVITNKGSHSLWVNLTGGWLWKGGALGWELLYQIDEMNMTNVDVHDWALNPRDPTDAQGDVDNDTLDNQLEGPDFWRTNPVLKDTDGDLLPDGWEVNFTEFDTVNNYWILDPANDDSDGDLIPDTDEDPDGDGLNITALQLVYTDINDPTFYTMNSNYTNHEEYLNGTDPLENDTDQDNLPDGYEVFYKDSDDDSMPDGWEYWYGAKPGCNGCLDPFNGNDRDIDQDLDGFPNWCEYRFKTDPLSAASKPFGQTC